MILYFQINFEEYIRFEQQFSFFFKLQILTAYILLERKILSSIIPNIIAILLWPP